MIEILMSERQIVRGLTDSQKKTLEEYATVRNPKYEQATRFSKWGAPKKIPKHLYFYDEVEGGVEVPRGIDVERLLGVPCKYEFDFKCVGSKYPPFKLELRKEQKDAAQAYLQAQRDSGASKGVIHLPTAKGKTVLALYLAQALGMKTLVLVHKVDLIDGWMNDIKLCFGDNSKVGLIRGKSDTIGENITIATVQTLAKRDNDFMVKLSNRFGMVILDECHHVGAPIFNILDGFKAKYKLGLSATPKRADGLDCCLEFFLGGLCYEYKYKEYDEDICSVEVRLCRSRFKFHPIVARSKQGVAIYNYDDLVREGKLPEVGRFEYLSDIPYKDRPKLSNADTDRFLMSNLDYRRQVLNDIYREYKQGHSIVAMFLQKEYIDLFYNSLIEYVPENEVMRYYGDSKEDDSVLKEKAESREVKITLATLAKATEGTNVKSWEVLFFVSSIASEKNVEQAVGRIRRRKEGKLEPVRVYDYQQGVYSLRNHIQPRLNVYSNLKCKTVRIN